MKKFILVWFFIINYSSSIIYSQDDPSLKGLQAINRSVIEAQLEFLASDWMEGRRAGERGEKISSDYIASMLKLYGIKPFGDTPGSINSSSDRSYFQNFNLLKTTPGPEQSLKLRSTRDDALKTIIFTNNIDFAVRPAANTEIEAPVVFVGYGFTNDKLGFNDLSDIDITGKFILRITGNPAFATSKLTRAELNASKKTLETIAVTKGAAGIIDVNPDMKILNTVSGNTNDMSPAEKSPRPYQVYSSYSIPGDNDWNSIARLVVSMKTAKEILAESGNSIDDYIETADADQKYSFKPVSGKTIALKTSVLNEIVPVRNILGIIEGTNKTEMIVIGAHYDHMGMNNGYLWNGADDNGSGTVGVMTLAKAIMETGKKPEKTIIIALWTAEEEGLLGSEFFINNLPFSREQVRLNVNFDMISRYISEDQKNKVVMTYSSSEKSFREMTVTNLKKYGIGLDVDYQPSDNPPGGSDHRSFVTAGIPVMRFKPGHREEYHTPDDEVSTIDWDIMEKIVKISFVNIWQLADSEW